MKPATTVPDSSDKGLRIARVHGQGKGVFTSRPYQLQDVILEFGGKKIPSNQISDYTHYLQIAPDMFLGPSGGYDDFVNHSCDPNCAVVVHKGKYVLKAIKSIACGKQLSFDYGTIMFNEPTTFECACGSVYCRKTIGNFFSLPQELQQHYLKNDTVPLLTQYTRDQLGF